MVEINNKTRSRIDLSLVKKVVEKFLKYYNIKNDISIAFVGDVTMRRLNKTYRSREEVTDVLAFPGEDDFLGEIIIDWAQIRRQASRYDLSEKKELIFVLVHGLLHLLGYEDKTERERREMIELGEKFLKRGLLYTI